MTKIVTAYVRHRSASAIFLSPNSPWVENRWENHPEMAEMGELSMDVLPSGYVNIAMENGNL